MPKNPGTVSKILWHFTGGPKWNDALNRQEKKPKPEAEALTALLGILKDKEVRIGKYKEVITVKGWSVEYTKTGRRWKRRNTLETLESSPVCCLADIPIAHLDYHAYRYGRMAIGFHRKAVVRHGFSPVFYQLQHSASLQALCDGMELIGAGGSFDVLGAIKILGGLLEERVMTAEVKDEMTDRDYDYNDSYEHEKLVDALNEAGYGQHLVSEGLEKTRALLSYIKTFTYHEFSTIYCEREWRATTSFGFSYSDIAMIVSPRRTRAGVSHEGFIARVRALPDFPSTVPIVAWEDLIEH